MVEGRISERCPSSPHAAILGGTSSLDNGPSKSLSTNWILTGQSIYDRGVLRTQHSIRNVAPGMYWPEN